ATERARPPGWGRSSWARSIGDLRQDLRGEPPAPAGSQHHLGALPHGRGARRVARRVARGSAPRLRQAGRPAARGGGGPPRDRGGGRRWRARRAGGPGGQRARPRAVRGSAGAAPRRGTGRPRRPPDGKRSPAGTPPASTPRASSAPGSTPGWSGSSPTATAARPAGPTRPPPSRAAWRGPRRRLRRARAARQRPPAPRGRHRRPRRRRPGPRRASAGGAPPSGPVPKGRLRVQSDRGTRSRPVRGCRSRAPRPEHHLAIPASVGWAPSADVPPLHGDLGSLLASRGLSPTEVVRWWGSRSLYGDGDR
ncbi:unnamed protein product, partial [Prorocentrum cordatum]